MENLHQSDSELVRMLVRGTTREMLDAARAVSVHGASAVGEVAALLASNERETRWRAAVALTRIGTPAVEALMAAATDENHQVRVPAIWALKHIGDRRSFDVLVGNLHGENECCRWMAAAALSQLGGETGRAGVGTAFADNPAARSIVGRPIGRT